MRKALTLATVAVALSLSACGRKPLETTPPPADQAAIDPNLPPPNDELGLTELPNSQAAMVAAAGSDTIYFGTDRFDLDDANRATLTAQARWLIANPAVRASVEGHADERGAREYNQALGERRANSAKNFLIAQGVPANRLLTISWGKERPVATGSDESAWAQNRRAVTVVVR
jgi:peptidoglycan-associated lipoprotein